MIRQPAVAGYFYPENPRELTELIEKLLHSPFGAEGSLNMGNDSRVRAVVSPHAGYLYSGAAATCAIKALTHAERRPTTYVLLGPNHRGMGNPVALSGVSAWKTPLGEVPVNIKAVNRLLELDPIFQVDDGAHRLEHSIEVQLPMMQHIIEPEVSILPISLFDQTQGTATRIGEALYRLSQHIHITILASSDFTHYEQDVVAREKDSAVLEHVYNLDVEGFFGEVREKRVSVCGPGGIAALMKSHKEWGGSRGKLLTYCTSGDTGGEKESVVGYAAVAFL